MLEWALNKHLKSLLFALTISSLLTGCSKPEDLTPWWNSYQFSGIYPLMAEAKPIVIMDKQAFIDSKSLIKDCTGKPIKNDDELLFLLKSEKIAVYNTETKSIRAVFKIREFGNVLPNLSKIQPTSSIYADLNKAMTISAEENQCSAEIEHLKKTYKWNSST